MDPAAVLLRCPMNFVHSHAHWHDASRNRNTTKPLLFTTLSLCHRTGVGSPEQLKRMDPAQLLVIQRRVKATGKMLTMH